MAIRIIKEGKKTKFTKTCPDCGCEFEYEAEDLKVDYTICLTTYPCQYNTYVICPCCGKHIHHGTTFADNWPKIGDPIPCSPNYPNNWPWITWTTGTGTELDCDKCPNKPDPTKIVVGDSPCTWCKKNQPYCTNYTVKAEK